MTDETATIEHWRRLYSTASRATFVALHPHPFLICQADLLPNAGWGGDTGKLSSLFHTQAYQPGPYEGVGPKLEGLMVIRVVKGSSSPFADRVSVGRAANCDIVVRDASISKLHGYFHELSAEGARFTDARAANGTRVDGELIAAGGAVVLRGRCQLTLGRVAFEVLRPSDLYDLL